MLVLTRKREEKIVIGGDIVITVTEVDSYRGVIRLGIEAPKDVRIERGERRDRLTREERDKKDGTAGSTDSKTVG